MLSNLKLDEVEAVLIDPHTHVRNALKVALVDAGFSRVRHNGVASSLVDTVQQHHAPDIIICDMKMENEKAVDIIGAMRRNDIGRNPFPCFIGITWDSSEDAVNRHINSGIDYLVRAPFAAGEVLNRIKSMINHRRDFVVASKYVGPDRREPERSDAIKDRLIKVPNSLRAKAMGEFNLNAYQKELEAASGAIQANQIDQLAEQILELATRIGADDEDASPERREGDCISVKRLADRMRQRALENGLGHVSTLCAACGDVVDDLLADCDTPNQRALALLFHLAQAIRVGLFEDEQAPRLANDIALTVNAAR